MARTLTVDEFIAWAEDRAEHYELVDGRPVALAPERAGHAAGKFATQPALREASDVQAFHATCCRTA